VKLAGFFAVFVCILRAQTPVAATLCNLTANPGEFKDRRVSVRAEALVGFETQALIDGACPTHRIWFELDEPKRDAGYRAATRAWKNNEFNIRKKVTATLIGYYDAGGCFGQQCYSRSQLRVRQVMNVTTVERRLAPDFSAYDCSLIAGGVRVPFQKGHIDNVPVAPLFLRRLEIVLTGPGGEPIVAEAHAILQVALTPARLKVLHPKAGVFRLSGLAPGAYVFSAVAAGFQPVTGCVVIAPNAAKTEPPRIELPLGVLQPVSGRLQSACIGLWDSKRNVVIIDQWSRVPPRRTSVVRRAGWPVSALLPGLIAVPLAIVLPVELLFKAARLVFIGLMHLTPQNPAEAKEVEFADPLLHRQLPLLLRIAPVPDERLGLEAETPSHLDIVLIEAAQPPGVRPGLALRCLCHRFRRPATRAP
jgi:hypothetical protein